MELRSLGYDADTVEGEGLAGVADFVVVAAARADERIILTLDKGMADIVRFPDHAHSGVILFRPGSVGRKAVLDFTRQRLAALLRLDLAHKVTVVTDERIRMRQALAKTPLTHGGSSGARLIQRVNRRLVEL